MKDKTIGKIITNIIDPECLERISYYFLEKGKGKDIIILSADPIGEMNILPEVKNYQLKHSYKDSIKIFDDIFKKENITTAVIKPDLFGLYLSNYLSAFREKQYQLIYFYIDDKLEPAIVNKKNLGKPMIRIIEYIKNNPGSDRRTIFQGAGFKPTSNSAYGHLSSLKNMHMVTEKDNIFYITDLGSTFLELIKM